MRSYLVAAAVVLALAAPTAVDAASRRASSPAKAAPVATVPGKRKPKPKPPHPGKPVAVPVPGMSLEPGANAPLGIPDVAAP